MAHLNPYIHFNGNADEAFTFYKSVFKTNFTKLMRYKDLASADFPVGDNDANRIMHIALPISNKSFLLGTDVMEVMGRVTENDNRNSISISAESREEADQLFNGLSRDGKIEMPMSDGPLGAYFGMFADRYGVQWMVEFSEGAR